MVQTQADNGNYSMIYGTLFKRSSQFKKASQKEESTEITRIPFLFCRAFFKDRTWTLTFQDPQNS